MWETLTGVRADILPRKQRQAYHILPKNSGKIGLKHGCIGCAPTAPSINAWVLPLKEFLIITESIPAFPYFGHLFTGQERLMSKIASIIAHLSVWKNKKSGDGSAD